jgi:hypothetical protein
LSPRPKAPTFADVVRDLGKKPKLARLGFASKEEDKPLWRLSLMDLDGPWGWSAVSEAKLKEILTFLQAMEQLTWTEIRLQQTGGGRRRGPKHKYIPLHSGGRLQASSRCTPAGRL